MRCVIQRVESASVKVNAEVVGAIEGGMLILLGVGADDEREEAEVLATKIAKMRIFTDENGKMNLNVQQVSGAALVVSQFTLLADCTNGNRPFFGQAKEPHMAAQLCEVFCQKLAEYVPVQQGRFGADMRVALTNDGPVTIVLDSAELMKK